MSKTGTGLFPVAISSKVKPSDHRSADVLYDFPCIRSGDKYIIVPTKVSAKSMLPSDLDTPKSHSFIPPFLSTKMFEGLMSLCSTCR